MDADELEVTLAHFTGSTELHRHWSKLFSYTDGVKFLADEAGAHWLLDVIASLQKKARKDPMLRDIQIWVLQVFSDKRAILNCNRDPLQTVFISRIPFTDFPLPEIKLYLENDVLCLPSER